jgi:hypothetical protein
MKQDWIEKCFGLAAACPCGYDHIVALENKPNGFFLMAVEWPFPFHGFEKSLLGLKAHQVSEEIARWFPSLEYWGGFEIRSLAETTGAKRFLK